MRTLNSLVFALAAVAATATVVPAYAQYDRRPSYDDNWERGAHDRGYQSGLAAGRDDARRGRGADCSRHDTYRRADLGFSFGGISIQIYQAGFRRGFDDGYRVGYAEFNFDSRRAYGGGGYYSSDIYRGPGYVSPSYRGDRYGYGRQGYAFDRGFGDGYREGIEDGRDGDRYDAVGHRDYRRGGSGFDRRSGSREDYRSGFRAGYDRGYREAARGGYARRPGWRW